MNIISRTFRSVRKAMGPVASAVGGWVSVIREPFSGAWQQNKELNREDLLGSPIVYACATRIANDFGKLRARRMGKDKDGIWSEAEGGDATSRLLHRPNRYQNHVQFKQWWQMSKQTRGNAYGLKKRSASGNIEAIYILNPDLVIPLVADDGSVYYQLGQDNLAGVQQGVTVPASEIIHDRMNCLYHPLVGVAPLYAAAIAAGIGVSIQKNTLQFFGNAAMPGGILVAPGAISKENAERLKEQWQSGYTGPNAGKVAVLGDGMKFEPLGRNAVDSQLIETLKWSDERVCSVFHVPAYKVGVGPAPSFNNVEALDRAYYSDCLQSPIEEFEAVMDDGLGLDGVNEGVELDLDGLMRMDSKTQMETLKAGVEGSLLTVNNGRKRLNLAPLEGGDTVYMQQQDYPLDQVRHNTLQQQATPVEAPEKAEGKTSAASGSIQQEALNGAQVTALQGLVFAVARGDLDSDTAAALIRVAFPLVSEEQIQDIFSGAEALDQGSEIDDQEEQAKLLAFYLQKEFAHASERH